MTDESHERLPGSAASAGKDAVTTLEILNIPNKN